jgi:hypothetical protein
MVLLGRIELPTSSLPMTRSTTELQQLTPKGGPMRSGGDIVKPLAPLTCIWHRGVMSKDSDTKAQARSDRLRDALRANLRRRKVKPDKHADLDPRPATPAD